MNIQSDLLQFYIQNKVLPKRQAESVLQGAQQANMSIRQYLYEKDYANEVEELAALGEYYRMPYAEVDMLEIEKPLLEYFSYEFMLKNKALPVTFLPDGTLLMAIGNPFSAQAVSMAASQFASEVEFVLTSPTQIDRYIESVASVASTAQALNDLNSEPTSGETGQGYGAKEDDVINNPAVRLVESIIKEAIPYRASDIHVEPFEKKVRVRYRIDGDLQDRAEFPIESYSAICARLKIMAGLNIAERRIPQDGRINMTVAGKEYDFRVSSLPTIYGEKFVIRILDKSTFRFSREDLGFTAEENELVNKMLERPHGIILLTGPTGCGKSTTLYSFIKELNKSEVNITTVEDPVEYTMAGVNQTQVNIKANMTFATALRSILRQDPDVIMVGEIRDEETAEIAVRAAITGHLVFSTLHTNDAIGAVVRLEDMGVQDYLVADALAGVIAQRLIKRLCPVCKKRSRTTAKEMRILGIDEPVTICRPVGCQYCNFHGFKGRIAVHEIAYMNEHMRSAVVGEKNLETLKSLAVANGMTTLWESGKRLVLEGITSIEELTALSAE